MLGGMRALPDDGWSARGDGSGAPPLAGPWRGGGMVQPCLHPFFARHCNCSFIRATIGIVWLTIDGEWWPLDRLDEAGLPTLFAKAARLALAATGEMT